MFLSNNIFYETIDDYMIQEICAGYYGEYNQYIIQMNVLIGKFLVYLFKIVSNVNWYFLFLIVLQFISFTTIGSYIIKIKGKMANEKIRFSKKVVSVRFEIFL